MMQPTAAVELGREYDEALERPLGGCCTGSREEAPATACRRGAKRKYVTFQLLSVLGSLTTFGFSPLFPVPSSWTCGNVYSKDLTTTIHPLLQLSGLLGGYTDIRSTKLVLDRQIDRQSSRHARGYSPIGIATPSL
jgi:hypothetical protein